MAIKNNVMIVRQRLLTKLVSLWNEGHLVEQIALALSVKLPGLILILSVILAAASATLGLK